MPRLHVVAWGLLVAASASAAPGDAKANPFRTSHMVSHVSADGVPYLVRTPDGTARGPHPLLLGVSGSEGLETLRGIYRLYAEETAPYVVVAVGGPDVRGPEGAERLRTILAEVSRTHAVDPDRQVVHANSLGTTAAVDLAFRLDQERFAAVWLTAPVATGVPLRNAARLGFTPLLGVAWGEGAPADAKRARTLLRAAAQAGYETTSFPRPGPHAPEVPSAEWDAMFAAFHAAVGRAEPARVPGRD